MTTKSSGTGSPLVLVMLVAVLVGVCAFFGGFIGRPFLPALMGIPAAPASQNPTPGGYAIALPPVTPTAPVAPPAQAASVQQAGSSSSEAEACPQARDLGPWAPNNGLGEDFEVTANETVSAGVVLGLWWPDGNTPWGKDEITSFLPTGLSIEVQDGAGRGFDYALGCTQGEIDAQMAEHMTQRGRDTSYQGFVDVDELIDLGLVVVRFDRRASSGN